MVENKSESVASLQDLSFSNRDSVVDVILWDFFVFSDSIIESFRNVVRVIGPVVFVANRI